MKRLLAACRRAAHRTLSGLAGLQWQQLNALSGLLGVLLLGVGLGLIVSAGAGIAVAGGCLVFDSWLTKSLTRRR